MPKYIFVTGGVVSSVGKGITVAALGRILKSRHISVSVQKLDPYLNVDPGTMSPYQHGEVFVTSDGAETDLDLGPLRALHRRRPDQGKLAEHGPDLQRRHPEGTPRRLPRRHDPGRAPPHAGDQGPHPRHRPHHRRPGRDHRGRRHRRRHRGPGVPRSDPPDAPRRAPGRHAFDPRHLPAVHLGHRRAQDQAHAALRAGAASHGYPARRHPAAQRLPGDAGDARQAGPVLRRRAPCRRAGAHGAQHLRSAGLLEDAGLGDYVIERLGLDAEPRDLADWRASSSVCCTPRPACASPSSASTSSCRTPTSL